MIDLLSVALGFFSGVVFEMLMNECKGTTDIKVRCENLQLKMELEETKKKLATYEQYYLVHNLNKELKCGDTE